MVTAAEAAPAEQDDGSPAVVPVVNGASLEPSGSVVTLYTTGGS